MYTFDKYFGFEIVNTATQSIIFFINKFSTFCVNLLCNVILLMHTTYRPSISSVLFQLKDLISENMKKMLAKVDIVFEKTSTVTYCFN